MSWKDLFTDTRAIVEEKVTSLEAGLEARIGERLTTLLTSILHDKIGAEIATVQSEMAVAIKSQLELELATIKTTVQDLLDGHMTAVTASLTAFEAEIKAKFSTETAPETTEAAPETPPAA